MYKEPNNSPVSQESVKSNWWWWEDEVRFSAMGTCYTLTGDGRCETYILDHNGEPIVSKKKPRIGFI